MTATTMRTTGRLAFRNLSRARGLYLTIGLLIAIPVAIGVTSASALRSANGLDDFFQQRYGSSDYVLDFDLQPVGEVDGAEADAIEALVDGLEAAGGEVVLRRELYVGAPQAFDVIEFDYESPLAAPVLQGLVGRPPTKAGEVMLTSGDLRDRGLAVGDRLPTWGDNSVLVVGSVDSSASFENAAFVAPGFLTEVATSPHGNTSLGISGLTLSEITSIADRHLPSSYFPPWSPTVAPSSYYETIDPSRPEQAGTLIAGALLVEAALLAGAAFAVGARRRVTEFGRLSAIGADSGQITAIMVAEAGFVSLAGAAVGAAAALAFTVGPGGLFEGYASWLTGDRVEGVEIRRLDVLGPMIVAIVAGVVACWWPAKRASQLSAVTALGAGSGRHKVRLWLVPLSFGVFALSLLAIGLASDTSFNGDSGLTTLLAIAAVIGVALTILGFGTLIVGSMATRRIGSLPTVLRLAVRESARHRQRTVAALSGAAFLLTGAVFAMTLLVSNSTTTTSIAQGETTLGLFSESDQSGWLDLADPTADRPDPHLAVSGAVSIPVGLSGGTSDRYLDEETMVFYDVADRAQPGVFGSSTDAIVSSQELLDTLRIPAEFHSVLEQPGSGLYLGAESIDGEFTVTTLSMVSDAAEDQEVALTGPPPGLELQRIINTTAYPLPELANNGFQLMIGPATIEALDLPEPSEGRLLYKADGFDPTELAALKELGVLPPVGPDDDPQNRFELVVRPQLIALAIVAGLLAVLYRIIGGLVAVEADRDLATMVSIGAPQHVRRRQLSAQVFVSLVIAIAIAVPLGFTTAFVTNETGWAPVDIDAPWVLIAGLGLLPLLIAAVTAATIRDSAPAMSRRLA